MTEIIGDDRGDQLLHLTSSFLFLARCGSISTSRSACEPKRSGARWTSTNRAHRFLQVTPADRRGAQRVGLRIRAPIKPTVGISALEGLDIRVGTIQAVEDMAGLRKLVTLTVSLRRSRTLDCRGPQAGTLRPLSAHRPPGAVRRQPRATDDGRTGVGRNAVRHRLRRQAPAGVGGPGAPGAGWGTRGLTGRARSARAEEMAYAAREGPDSVSSPSNTPASCCFQDGQSCPPSGPQSSR